MVADVHGKLAKPYWYPAFDNLDGSERIWESFEISKMSASELDKLSITPKRNEFLYLWTISIYYSVLILGGNEMQPSQVSDMVVAIALNVVGLIMLNYIAGEIAGNVAILLALSLAHQDEIDVINTTMKNR